MLQSSGDPKSARMARQGHRVKKTYTTARRNPAAAICHDNVASAATRGFQFLMITHMSAAKAMARENQRISGKFITFFELVHYRPCSAINVL